MSIAAHCGTKIEAVTPEPQAHCIAGMAYSLISS